MSSRLYDVCVSKIDSAYAKACALFSNEDSPFSFLWITENRVPLKLVLEGLFYHLPCILHYCHTKSLNETWDFNFLCFMWSLFSRATFIDFIFKCINITSITRLLAAFRKSPLHDASIRRHFVANLYKTVCRNYHAQHVLFNSLVLQYLNIFIFFSHSTNSCVLCRNR